MRHIFMRKNIKKLLTFMLAGAFCAATVGGATALVSASAAETAQKFRSVLFDDSLHFFVFHGRYVYRTSQEFIQFFFLSSNGINTP